MRLHELNLRGLPTASYSLDKWERLSPEIRKWFLNTGLDVVRDWFKGEYTERDTSTPETGTTMKLLKYLCPTDVSGEMYRKVSLFPNRRFPPRYWERMAGTVNRKGAWIKTGLTPYQSWGLNDYFIKDKFIPDTSSEYSYIFTADISNAITTNKDISEFLLDLADEEGPHGPTTDEFRWINKALGSLASFELEHEVIIHAPQRKVFVKHVEYIDPKYA